MNRISTDDDLCVVALVKGAERFVILYHPTDAALALRQLGHWATNPELDFTWYDAAKLAQRIRQEAGS